jgi:hypothetical protein
MDKIVREEIIGHEEEVTEDMVDLFYETWEPTNEGEYIDELVINGNYEVTAVIREEDPTEWVQETLQTYGSKIQPVYEGGVMGSFFRGTEPKGPLNIKHTDIAPEVWQKEINEVWEHLLRKGEDKPRDRRFLNAIWNASTNILPGLEISVIVDRNGKLFMNSGSPGYVDYGGVNVTGMSIPIRCWIHTHPFGYAFWSGTDNRTLRNWRPINQEAIVIGKGEHMIWEKTAEGERMTKVVDREAFEL